MELPERLTNAVELNAAAWRPQELKKAAAAVSDRYMNESGTGKRLVVSEIGAAVYSVMRMPATYCAVSSALRYTDEITGIIPEIHSVLDIGAGTGAAAWALFSGGASLREIICLEREAAMSDLGKRLARSEPALSDLMKWLSSDINNGLEGRSADMVLSSYMLNELSSPDRKRAVSDMWDSAGKLLLLVEPGTPAGYNNIMQARELLLSRGAHIAAPCPHENECRLQNDWCHFTVRVQRTRLHKLLKNADVPYEDEKFIYMAFVRDACKVNGGRVLRHPITEKGRVTLSLCTAQENSSVTVTKKQGELYRISRKAKCGDLLGI